jgi:hypothetical protein
MVPHAEELAPLLREPERRSHAIHPMRVGRIECVVVDDLGMALAVGGHGTTSPSAILESRPV